jgi:hypothetical protein
MSLMLRPSALRNTIATSLPVAPSAEPPRTSGGPPGWRAWSIDVTGASLRTNRK